MTDGFEDDHGEPARSAPKVFTRVITTPPALPWEQVRAAGLDARMNAPVASPDITAQVRRLDPWRPGRPGRFLAAYARLGDIGDGFTSECRVDGRLVPVVFVSASRRQAQLRKALLLAAGGCATLVAFLGGGGLAVAGRLAAEQSLSTLEARAEHQARLTSQRSLLQAQDRALDRLGGDQRAVSALLADMAWAADARVEGVSVEGFHWRPDFFAVEARAEESPFGAAPGREVERAARPVRPGVWLWGVQKSAKASEADR